MANALDIVGQLDRRVLALSFLCAVGIALSGCAPAPQQQPTPSNQVGQSPGERRTELLRACLAADGWNVEVKWDGTVSGSIPAGQQSAFSADNKACVAAAQAEIPLPPIDEESLRALYEAELANYNCIEHQGYELPAPPSVQTFVDTYLASPWSASGLLTPDSFPTLFAGDADGLKQLLTECRPPNYYR